MKLTARLQLRDYQEVGVADTISAIHEKPILVLPTGGGKTVCGTEIIERVSVPTLWLTHRKELIEQAADRLQSHGLYVGIIKSGIKGDRFAAVQVASVQTLIRLKDWPQVSLIVVDEAHHSTADTYRDIIKKYPGVPLVGLTATPFRMDGSGLGDIFGKIIAPTSTAELCDNGTLHRPRVWCGKAPDLKGVKMMAGEYDKKEVAKRLKNTDLTGDIVATWFERAGGVRTVCFASNVEHSHDICNEFLKAGVSAEHLDGNTPKEERKDILERLAMHDTQIVSNCDVLTEGWDLPSLGCAIIARPTGSLNKHLQMIGRIMRACEGKTGATVLDHAGNHHIHGLVTRPIAFSLESKAGKSDPLGMRRCNRCGMYFETSIFACPDCGWMPTRGDAGARATPPVKAAGELVEFVEGHAARADLWKHLEAERIVGNHGTDWAKRKFTEKCGVDAEIVCGELFNKADDSHEYKCHIYAKLLLHASGGGLPEPWVAREYRRLFGVWPRNVSSPHLKRGAMLAKYQRMMGAI